LPVRDGTRPPGTAGRGFGASAPRGTGSPASTSRLGSAGRHDKERLEALEAIGHGISLLERSPFSCRKASPGNAFLRELIVAFGATGYVALFEIDDDQTVTVLAERHQREDDYH